MAKRGKIPCPVCGRNMVKAFVDPKTYKELSKSLDMIEVVHVYYGCPNEDCETTVRLRFRKDGLPGDLYKEIQKRRAEGKVLQDFGGTLGDIE